MNSAHLHRQKYPGARPTTLAYLEKRDETTARLRAEIAAMRRKNFFDRVLSWVWGR
ncbi:MAG TPA: hypothetical protein VGC14_25215 [Rhizobium sp.]